jgi:hypothetical protein
MFGGHIFKSQDKNEMVEKTTPLNLGALVGNSSAGLAFLQRQHLSIVFAVHGLKYDFREGRMFHHLN